VAPGDSRKTSWSAATPPPGAGSSAASGRWLVSSMNRTQQAGVLIAVMAPARRRCDRLRALEAVNDAMIPLGDSAT
jgi:hypothetical protein